jgi:cytochrome P450 PksS
MPPEVNFNDPVVRADPYPLYARLRKEAPVIAIRRPLFGQVWLLTRYEDVLMALNDKRFINDRRNVGDGQTGILPWWMPRVFHLLQANMLSRDLGDHRRLRDLVHKAFTPRMVDKMKASVERIVGRLLDEAEKKQTVDLITDVALPLPLEIISEMMGVSPEDRRNFHRWIASFLDALGGSPLAVLAQAPTGFLLMRLFRKLIRQRREQPGDDLISALVQAEEKGDHLNEEELISMIFLLLLAGHETTVNLIGSGMLALLQNPDQFQKLREQPELIDSAIEELLRYANPVEQPAPRYTREDVELGGHRIPRGAMVIPVVASANRDESMFPNADTLDITRSPNRHVSFGMGVHYCLGAPLARLEGRIALLALVQRFPRMRLAVPAEKLRWRTSLSVRGLKALPLHLT